MYDAHSSDDDSQPQQVAPWYVEAFRDGYRELYSHRNLEAARVETEWLARSVLAGVDGPVLDDCCGFGRHSLALRERGIDVFGIDLSFDLLRASRELPGSDALLEGRLARADMRALPFADGAFAAVVNLFTSFGYLGDAGDRDALLEMARVLRPGGPLVMDLMNPARIREGLVPHTVEERAGRRLESWRVLTEGGRRVVKKVEVTGPDGAVRRWEESVRMFEAGELDDRLGAAGLRVEGRVGDFGGAPYDPGSSERQIVLARRSRP